MCISLTAVCGTMWVVALPVMVFLTATLTAPTDEEDIKKHPTLCVFAKMPAKAASGKPKRDRRSVKEWLTDLFLENCDIYFKMMLLPAISLRIFYLHLRLFTIIQKIFECPFILLCYMHNLLVAIFLSFSIKLEKIIANFSFFREGKDWGS